MISGGIEPILTDIGGCDHLPQLVTVAVLGDPSPEPGCPMSGAARHTEASHPRTLGVLHGGDGGDAKCGRQDAGWGLSNELTPGTHASGQHGNAGSSQLGGNVPCFDIVSRHSPGNSHPESGLAAVAMLRREVPGIPSENIRNRSMGKPESTSGNRSLSHRGSG